MTIQPVRGELALAAQRPALWNLSASQSGPLDLVKQYLDGGSVVVVRGDPGVGKTLLLRHLHREMGGRLLTISDIFDQFARRNPSAMEEAVIDFLEDAVRDNDIVFVDDLSMVIVPEESAERPAYMSELLASFFALLRGRGKKMVLTDNTGALSFGYPAVVMPDLGPQDYRQLIEFHSGRQLENLDFDEVFRIHRQLTGNALAIIGRTIAREDWDEVTSDAIVGFADEFIAQTNLDVATVADVSFDTLVGVEQIVEQLERNLIVPMTQPALARELNLKPKRGVLLYGPPGTGKTTIGRALAKQMQGKFFLIDGTFDPSKHDFYMKFNRMLIEAVKNSPSVFFIDDADVIFRNGQQTGLARLLLSKLDGLESETQSNVCIVMTAMDVADMPPAMVRSGRVEVWLEMELPKAERRVEMVRFFAKGLPDEMLAFDAGAVGEATDGFTPADIRGVVGDARSHVAYDRQAGKEVQTFEHYLLLAAAEVANRKARLAALR